MKKNILFLIFFFLTYYLFFIKIWYSAYLPHLDEYRWIGEYLIEKPYKNYKNLSLQKEKDEDFFVDETNRVQVKTIFDFYSNKRSEKIEFVKNQILQKIKNKEIVDIWYDPINNIINKIERPWKYFVVETAWDIIPISEDIVLYLFDYKIIWKEKLIDIIKQQILKNQNNKEDIISTNISRQNEELLNITKILDEYKIKYIKIWKSIDWSFYIWKGNGLKVEWKEQFFINKIFTTPELKEKIDDKKKNRIYFWTYITDNELNTKYYAENNWLNSDVFIKILWDTVYNWTIKNEQRIYQSNLYPSSKDLFVYIIKKNNYEYIILIISFILWNVFWIYLTFNFVNNFKNNFKRTPEEI